MHFIELWCIFIHTSFSVNVFSINVFYQENHEIIIVKFRRRLDLRMEVSLKVPFVCNKLFVFGGIFIVIVRQAIDHKLVIQSGRKNIQNNFFKLVEKAVKAKIEVVIQFKPI